MKTGFFGIPGGRPGGLVHIVGPGDKPVCGTVLHPDSQFQRCCDGVNSQFIECRRCLKWLDKHIQWRGA